MDGKQVMGDQLCGVRLCRCDCDLRACPCIHDAVCLSGNGTADHVYDAKCGDALCFCFTQRSEGICGLSGLTDDHDQVVFAKNGIAIAEFTGQIHFYRDTRQAFHDVFCRHAGVVSASACHDVDTADGSDLLLAHAQLLDDDLAVLDPGG